jgi:hypothetical protein
VNNPRNQYTPGQPLPDPLHAIGRPVTFFHANYIEAGTVTKATLNNGATTYDIRVISGGTFRNCTIGTLMNPQPNTFVYAP